MVPKHSQAPVENAASYQPRSPLTLEEIEGIVLAVNSAFRKLKNLYAKIVPVFEDFGFTAAIGWGHRTGSLREDREGDHPALRVVYARADGHCDLCRFDQDWEVKICKDSGLTINQSKVIDGENYIVVNYRANSQVKRVWVLWEAQDASFPRDGRTQMLERPTLRNRDRISTHLPG